MNTQLDVAVSRALTGVMERDCRFPKIRRLPTITEIGSRIIRTLTEDDSENTGAAPRLDAELYDDDPEAA